MSDPCPSCGYFTTHRCRDHMAEPVADPWPRRLALGLLAGGLPATLWMASLNGQLAAEFGVVGARAGALLAPLAMITLLVAFPYRQWTGAGAWWFKTAVVIGVGVGLLVGFVPMLARSMELELPLRTMRGLTATTAAFALVGGAMTAWVGRRHNRAVYAPARRRYDAWLQCPHCWYAFDPDSWVRPVSRMAPPRDRGAAHKVRRRSARQASSPPPSPPGRLARLFRRPAA